MWPQEPAAEAEPEATCLEPTLACRTWGPAGRGRALGNSEPDARVHPGLQVLVVWLVWASPGTTRLLGEGVEFPVQGSALRTCVHVCICSPTHARTRTL